MSVSETISKEIVGIFDAFEENRDLNKLTKQISDVSKKLYIDPMLIYDAVSFMRNRDHHDGSYMCSRFRTGEVSCFNCRNSNDNGICLENTQIAYIARVLNPEREPFQYKYVEGFRGH